MSNVIDARPDRFLREMRDHGDWTKACEGAGMTSDEVNSLCQSNPKFDLAQVECQLEYIEDLYTQRIEKTIADARVMCAEAVAKFREEAMEDYHARRKEERS